MHVDAMPYPLLSLMVVGWQTRDNGEMDEVARDKDTC